MSPSVRLRKNNLQCYQTKLQVAKLFDGLKVTKSRDVTKKQFNFGHKLKFQGFFSS